MRELILKGQSEKDHNTLHIAEASGIELLYSTAN